MNKYLVIGNPISHSLSPKLHNYWFKQTKIEAEYEKRKLNDTDLGNVILEMKENKINGLNVTIPFKNKIIPFLDDLTYESRVTQSVNTIYLEEDKVVGHNTDIYGFKKSLEKVNFDLTNKSIFILGAGGVVPSIIFALNEMKVSEIFLSNRTKEKAENLKKMFANLKVLDWGNIPNFDVIINATSIGLKNDDLIDLDLSKIGKNKLFYDLIYNPIETNFLKVAKKQGNIFENGKLMFVYQAFQAFKIWHGLEPEINNELLDLLNE